MAHVQSVSENSYSATVSHTIALTGVTAGNALLVIVREAIGSVNDMSSVSSSADGAFTLLSDADNGVIRLKTYVLANASAGTHTITGTAAAIEKTFRWALLEYDSVPASSVVDDYDAGTFSTTTTPSTNAITTTGTSRVVVSVVATDLSATTIAGSGGESERQEVNERFQVQDAAASTAGDYSASWTLGATQPGVWSILALKPATAATTYLKLLASASAQSDTGVTGHVFNADESAYIGKFTGAAFEASLESGDAVLKVPVTEFGGSALTTSDTPKAFIYSSTDASIGPASCTVIEE